MTLSVMKKFERRIAAAALMGFMVLGCLGTPHAEAQKARRSKRESNANRRARVARTIEETYGHRWEVGGGGGFLRFRPGKFKQQNNEVTFWASTMYALNPKLGIVAIGEGGFGNAKLGNNSQNAVNPQIQHYAFLAGPSYRFLAHQHYTISAFAAGGAAKGRFSTGPKDFPPVVVGLWPSDLRPAFSAGVNLDYNLSPNLAFRITPTYLGTTFGGELEQNKGLNVGVIYRFGNKK